MAWIILIIAGLLEVGWTIGLKYSEGFTKPLPSIITAITITASMVLLGKATQTLPIGTAYAVWVGIGAAGASVAGMVLFKEPLSVAKLVFLLMLIVSIVGLKLTSGK